MNIEFIGAVLAVVTLNPTKVAGGAPVFIAQSDEEQQKTALILSRVLKGMVHDLENGTFIIVKH